MPFGTSAKLDETLGASVVGSHGIARSVRASATWLGAGWFRVFERPESGLGEARPSIYRALRNLECDGFLHSWEESAAAGAARSVYGVTEAGYAALSVWMGVVGAERDAFDSMLKRFDALDE